MFCAWALAIVATEFHDLAILTDWTLLSAKSFTGRSSPFLSAFSTTTSFSAKEEFFVVFVSELFEVCSDRSSCRATSFSSAEGAAFLALSFSFSIEVFAEMTSY